MRRVYRHVVLLTHTGMTEGARGRALFIECRSSVCPLPLLTQNGERLSFFYLSTRSSSFSPPKSQVLKNAVISIHNLRPQVKNLSLSKLDY